MAFDVIACRNRDVALNRQWRIQRGVESVPGLGSLEAYRAAASRCASLSTEPDNVTIPFEDCTPICLPCSPESLLSLLWISLLTCASFGALLQPTATAMAARSTAT